MDEVDAVPRSRRQRPKDSFQNELQAKLSQRKSLGLSAEVTDSDEDGLGSLHNSDYRTRRATRPGSAKYRSDKSPDLSRGLGTTTMRARDLTQLLSHSGGHSDDDDDEEVMAATLGKSKTGSWQPPSYKTTSPSYKTPSPKQDSSKLMRRTPTGGSPKESSHLESIYGRKTPSMESPKEQSKLDTIFGRKTPTADSPKDQSRLDSLYGRSKTPTKESTKDQGKLESLYGKKTPTRESPKESGKYDLYDRKTPTKERGSPGLTKEDIIFGRKTASTADSRRLPGMDAPSDKPWQPPNFRSVSPGSSPDHSRGSRGVTPTESMLDPINETPREKMTPRMQRGERLRGDDSPNRQVSFGEKPKPQARSRVGDRKASPTLERQDGSSMKRATPTMDLFGKTRSSAAQEVEDMMESDRKGRLSRDSRRTPESPRGSFKDKREAGKRADSRSPSVGRASRLADGKKTPTGTTSATGQRGDYLGRNKSPYDKKSSRDEEIQQKQNTQSSSLLDFLTGGSDSKQTKAKDGKKEREINLRKTDDDIDNMFAAHRKPAPRTTLTNGHGRMSPDQQHGSKRPSIRGRSSPQFDDRRRRMNDVGEVEEEEDRDRERRKPEVMKEERRKQPRDSKNDDTSSVCEEIPLDPAAKLVKAEEKAKKSGKQTSERARADNVIDTIADAQTMMYIEPAKKVRPVTAEAKVQHRPKPRYGTLPGSATQTMNERQFNSTSDIRDAIYEDWYADRIKQAKRKKREEEKKKKEEEEKKRKDKEEKQQEAQLSYKAWTEQKKETTHKEQAKKRREEEAKRQKEEDEKEEKKEESKKLFEHWKQDKDARIKHEIRKKRDKEDEERRIKEEEEYIKRKDKESAYRGWQRRKEEELKNQKKSLRDEKKYAKTKKEEEYEEQRRKEDDSLRRYNDWMEDKERQKRREKRHMSRSIYEEEKPAWSPASRTIPFGR